MHTFRASRIGRIVCVNRVCIHVEEINRGNRSLLRAIESKSIVSWKLHRPTKFRCHGSRHLKENRDCTLLTGMSRGLFTYGKPNTQKGNQTKIQMTRNVFSPATSHFLPHPHTAYRIVVKVFKLNRPNVSFSMQEKILGRKNCFCFCSGGSVVRKSLVMFRPFFLFFVAFLEQF